MRMIHTFLLASLLALPAAGFAQDAPPIEQAMSAQEFKAALEHVNGIAKDSLLIGIGGRLLLGRIARPGSSDKVFPGWVGHQFILRRQ